MGKYKNVEDFRPSQNSPTNSRIVTNKDGSKDIYSSAKDIFNSKSHAHKHIDKHGKVIYNRPEGKKNSKFYYVFKALSSCSFEELQYIEAISTNDYVKNATRRLMYLMMNYGLDEEHCSLKVCQKR